MNGLNELALPDRLGGYWRIDGAESVSGRGAGTRSSTRRPLFTPA
jgi:hypothetical protein